MFEVVHGQLGQVAWEPTDYCCIFSPMGNLNVGVKPSQMIGVLITQTNHKETALKGAKAEVKHKGNIKYRIMTSWTESARKQIGVDKPSEDVFQVQQGLAAAMQSNRIRE